MDGTLDARVWQIACPVPRAVMLDVIKVSLVSIRPNSRARGRGEREGDNVREKQAKSALGPRQPA
eukprot:362251-Chlamydomonas_euryale.AAC.11